MTYLDQANLADDTVFRRRLSAALVSESVLKSGDFVADSVLRSPTNGANMFMPLIAAAPGFGGAYAAGGQESINDNQILAAMQANWARVTALYEPSP
jgi:hypothetical protein